MKRFQIFSLLVYFLLLGVSSGPFKSEAEHAIVQTKETVVYITKTGEKYHKDGCRYLRQSKIKTTKQKATKQGYTACKICKP